MDIRIKRIYEPGADDDGFRALVDRLWPRGIKKEEIHIDAWIKDVAPSGDLRKWFSHDPVRWPEFQRKYRQELDDHGDVLAPLIDACSRGRVTLLYAAKDEAHNDAVVLRDYLLERLG